MNDTPYLSVVAMSRNDDHGGNLRLRMQLFVNCLAAQAQRHRLRTELILVEWNPPADRPKLKEILSFPARHAFCSMRIIEVPATVHARYRHAKVLPVYQMIAKNVGIRRARGRFVLATNVDIVLSDPLFARLAAQDLESGRWYRSIRHDVGNRLNDEMPVGAILDYCANSLIRVNLRDYSLNMRDGSKHIVYPYPPGATERLLGWAKLFTNGCGDFTLLAADEWCRLRGYAEMDMFSFHLDSLFLYCAHFAGLRELVFPEDCVHYHIEHEEGWTPEIHRDRTLDARLDEGKIDRLNNRSLRQLLSRMHREQKPLVFNSAGWGLVDERLPEEHVTAADWEAPNPEDSRRRGEDTDVCEGERNAPYLSIVVTTRNDDHGGNQRHRFQTFLDHLSDMCARHDLKAELIVVEWNPDPSRPSLGETLRWPDPLRLPARVIVVPPEVHRRYRHAEKLPLFQMLAKNVGIRRAQGEYVLATNIDILFSNELAAWLARGELQADCYYRIDRHDVGETTIPQELSRDEVLDFCARHVVRVQGQHGTYARGEQPPGGDSNRLHTNACGDFTLMARTQWERLKGYPEFQLWSIYLDGLLLHAAHAAGLKQTILRPPQRIYHIEHSLGWAVTQDTIAERPSLDYRKDYLPLCQEMLQNGQTLNVNSEDWGLRDRELREYEPGLSKRRTASSSSTVSQHQDSLSIDVFRSWIERVSSAENRLYYRDQSPRTMLSLAKYAQELGPSVIVELGTLAGLSLRTWVASAEQARIYAVDLSFRKLRETMAFLPVDLSRVTLLEQDILQTDFSSLWTPQDRVIFFVDAHDLPNVPIMAHVLTAALPALPDGSLVIVDDLWFSEERLTQENARCFLEGQVLGEVDELQCFDGHFAPYHAGGSFMGFAEVIPLLKFVNRRCIELVHKPDSKHVCFVWKKEYLSDHPGPVEDDPAPRIRECGRVSYNPLESVPSGPLPAARMRDLATVYRQGRVREVFKSLADLLTQHPHDQGLSYGLALCLARSGMLARARDILAKNASGADHPRYQRLLDDLVQRIGPSDSRRAEASQQGSEGDGTTIFAVPKPFKGHLATIQKNAIRSWTRLRPAPEIVLIGDEAGTREMAEEVGARHIPDIRRNEFGTPLVDSIFQTAQDHASHAIMAYVNADMILFQDFALGVQKVQADLSKFLLIGRRWDLPIVGEIAFDQPQWQRSLRRQVEEHAMLHGECGLDYFVFPKGLYGEIPPFAIGRTVWDNWLVMTPHKLGVPVVDGTEFITAVHQDHDYGHAVGGRDGAWTGAEARRNRALAGATDNSGRTSGATRALRSDGTIVTVRPREPSYMTATYRAQRSTWLLKQADRLVTAGRKDLAAAKWEEAVVFQEVLLASGWPGDKQPESMSGTDLARHYAATCLRLAQHYAQMGCFERAAAALTRPLKNPCVQMPPAQREKFTRLRNQLSRSAHRHPQSTCLPIVAKQPGTGTETRSAPTGPERALTAKPVTPPTRLTLPASTDSDVDGSHTEVLSKLERSYKSIPNGVPAKHARAVRLAELFRRAGLVDKSRSYGMEATLLKNASASRGRSQCVASGTVAPAATNDQPKVTVITACRNAERFLPQCLESVLHQTMSEWELLLLDDGSTDGTRQVMADYAGRDARVKPFYFDDQTGPYIRRNFAIERARAPFIVIQDADDIMCPDKLRRLRDAIRRAGDAGIVGSFYRKFLDDFQTTEYTEDVTLATSHEKILELYRTRRLWDFCWHGSAIIRKDLFDEIGLYDENPFGADSFWLAKVLEYACHTGKTRLVNIPEFLTLRRVHADSQTGVLSPLDPRGRRVRYRQYCECRLRRVRDRMQSVPGTDMGCALRACSCGDFLTRFKAQIIAWESEPLGDRVIPGFLQRAVHLFNAGHYISCVNVLNGVESFEPTVARRVMGYDLLRGMAFFAVRLNDRSRMCLDREIQRHDNPGARAFREEAFALSPPVDVRRWCRENAERYDLELTLSDNAVPSETVLCAGAVGKQQGDL